MLFLWLGAALGDLFDLQLPDGDLLTLTIDPENKKYINVRVDGADALYIPIVKPPPTLEETFSLPEDLIPNQEFEVHTAKDETTSKVVVTAQESLSTLFDANDAKPDVPAKFNGDFFKERVSKYSDELFRLLIENDKKENLETVYSEAKYQEDAIRNFFRQQKEVWDKDANAREIFRRKKIEVLERLFLSLFFEIRDQLSKHTPDFDELKVYLKTVNAYNADILKKDDPTLI